ncbi:4Fe-4S cluster-binding domain-containing protein [Vagococcus fluvialis]|uniref:4Fe-4S cluster-binding domain-containing protein n=1 Tax=Vagococcus fluvialis TaxID=2738 RepID=UPI001D09D9F0|nr:4Fe-4S cluster-binding domain-containing protein [Vagococcus fluvialis]UDM72709.1 4Fe-4S cluster-binding domain-containing protein [Vagococcus fluvialis]UDM78432.1 4Fe-4S cluster-binding domain-containing protein [Vagococcus fluvialis]UDM83984.1 4Fe-4S cluster-binding domain-containing protein [Vagococcus fluvialis]
MARLHLLRETDLHNCYWGISTSLWFNGCPHKCLGCWNRETWDIDESLEIPNNEVIERTLKALDDPFPKDLTLLGGDPLMPNANLDDVVEIVSAIKKARPHTRVLCWTGFRIEPLIKTKKFRAALELIDVLIDGRYEQSLHVTGKKYGSSNQRIIDVKETLKIGKVVIAPENYERNKQ